MLTREHINEAADAIRSGEYAMCTWADDDCWFDLNGRWTVAAVVMDIWLDGWWEWDESFKDWLPLSKDKAMRPFFCNAISQYFNLIDEYCCSDSERADMLKVMPSCFVPVYLHMEEC